MQTLFLFLNMGGYEILLIILVILIFFGAKKIPELARGMGRGIREFKDATREITSELEDSVNNDKPATSKAKNNTSTGSTASTNGSTASTIVNNPTPATSTTNATAATAAPTNNEKA